MHDALKADAPEPGRIRIVYRMAVGIEAGNIAATTIRNAVYALDDAFTRITGGIVRLNGIGTWTQGSEDGDFSGPLERNATFTYLLSVIPDHEAKSLANIRQTTRAVIREFELPVTHIHMERSLTEACHFKMDAQNVEA